jgi:type VI secretion system secreted protein Hcp
VTQSALHAGGGGGAGKANFQDMSVTKRVDLSSAKLFNAASTGKHIKEALLTVRKAGDCPRISEGNHDRLPDLRLDWRFRERTC